MVAEFMETESTDHIVVVLYDTWVRQIDQMVHRLKILFGHDKRSKCLSFVFPEVINPFLSGD